MTIVTCQYSTVKWMDLFLAAVDDCVPKVQVKSANSAPWIDAEVSNAVRKKERLRKKAKKSSTEYHRTAFRRCRAELKSLIKWKREQYFKSLSSTITENPKRSWAYNYQSKYKSKRLPPSVQHNGVKVYDAKENAELFNKYFNSVFKIDNGDPLQEDCFFSDYDGDTLSNISISPADVCLGLP